MNQVRSHDGAESKPAIRDMGILFLRQHVLERSKTLLMPLTLLGLWAAIAGLIDPLNSFGFPYLFWHEVKWFHASSCMGLGVFIGAWCFTSFILDTRKESTWLFQRFDKLDWQSATKYLFFSSFVISLAFSVAPLACASREVLPSQPNVWLTCFATFVFLMVGISLFWLLGWLLWRISVLNSRTILLERLPVVGIGIKKLSFHLISEPVIKANNGSSEVVWLHRLALRYWSVFFLMLIGTTVLANVPSTWAAASFREMVIYGEYSGSPAWYVCLLLVMLVTTYGAVVYHRQAGFVWILFYVAIISVGVVGLKFGKESPIREIGILPAHADLSELLGLDTAIFASGPVPDGKKILFDRIQFVSQLPSAVADPRTKPKLVVVATSGGGIKAQVWTSVVLCALEERLENFPYCIQTISGASGGMVGATYYVTTLAPPDTNQLPFHASYQASELPTISHEALKQRGLSKEQLIENMSKDALAPIVRSLFYNDFLGCFIQNDFDRGTTLERTWERFTCYGEHGKNSPLDQPFSALADSERIWRPSLIFTPTMADDGRRLLISNRRLPYLAHTAYSVLGADSATGIASVSSLEWKAAFPNSMLRLSTAARLSANFPLIVKSPILETNPKRHIMDAGYYDNYGGSIASRWLHYNRKWITSENVSGILLINISAGVVDRAIGKTKQSSFPEGAGFVNASFQKSVFSSDEMIGLLDQHYNHDEKYGTDQFFTVVNFEYGGPASLSWYLNSAEKYSLIKPFLADPDDTKPLLLNGVFEMDKFSKTFRNKLNTGRSIYERGMLAATDKTKTIQDAEEKIADTFYELMTWWNTDQSQSPNRGKSR